MDQKRFRRVADLFDAVAALPGAERAAYLDLHCDDAAVRCEVEQLLAHDAAPGALHSGALRSVMSESLADSAMPPPEQIAGYRVLREIGRGGMGVVYLAEQSNPKRQIALKVIRPGVSTQGTLRRFELEAHVLGRLQHPGIAQVLEAGSAEIGGSRQPYIAMEFVAGEPLGEYVHKRATSLVERVELVIRICDAVQHAHQRGVIHRDLKPANILVAEVDTTGGTEPRSQSGLTVPVSSTRSDGYRDDSSILDSRASLRVIPKILDFGVARLADDSVDLTRAYTHVGQVIGTLAYMSPEQLRGDPLAVDTRADVYALGVILFELLTGRLPLVPAGSSLADAMRSIQEDEVPRLTTLNRGVPRDLETIALKALEKDPARRYSSAAELAADLRRFLADEPILARPPTLRYQFSKFARRNRALVGGAALAVLALVIGSIATTWQWARAVRGEQRAAKEADTAQEQAAIAQAITAFLTELLTASDPEQSDTERDVRVSTVLERAEAKLDSGSLHDHPETEIGVRTTLARIGKELGRFDAAEAHLRRVMELLAAAGRSGGREAATAMNDLGSVMLAALRYDHGESIIREAVERSKAAFGPQAPETASALGNLGQLLQYRQQYAEAEPLLRQASELLVAAGEKHAQLAAVALNNLGNLKRETREYAAAEPIYREAIAIIRRKLGDRSSLLAIMLNNLGLCLKFQGRLAETEPLYREALAIRRAKLPAGHPVLAESLNNMGALLRDRQEFAAAEPYFREALEIAEKCFPPGHQNIAFSRRSVGVCLSRAGRFAEAEPLLLKSYEDLAANPLAANHARDTVRHLVYLYEEWEKAEPGTGKGEKTAEWRTRLPPASAPAIASPKQP